MYRCRFLLVPIVGVLAVGLCLAEAADVDTVKEKLFQAKKAFDVESQKFRKAVTDQLDKREDDARKAGDKKVVDQVKTERERFEKWGEFPLTSPLAASKSITAARATLNKAYTDAVKDYTKIKEDAAAETIEKEQRAFQLSSLLMFGKRTFLVGLKHSDLRVENATGFSNNGTDALSKTKLKLDGMLIPHSIYLVPPPNGYSEVTYPLKGKPTAFRVTVGVTRIGEDAGDPGTPLVFEVLGDGKPLWKSKPIPKLDVYESCELPLEKVQKLTLRVICDGRNTLARAVWYEPILVE
ncbi:MAG: NPCBM/NEW2 domain-containing protein [Planctomycetes bacterium]|nr:NPCBM/NEW2 domain-containing protein [Planctomycetota bacterium]